MVVLTSVMIGGLILLLGLVVTQITRSTAPFALPDRVELPEGTRAEAVTLSSDWVLVLSREGELLLFDRASGALRQTIALPVAGPAER